MKERYSMTMYTAFSMYRAYLSEKQFSQCSTPQILRYSFPPSLSPPPAEGETGPVVQLEI